MVHAPCYIKGKLNYLIPYTMVNAPCYVKGKLNYLSYEATVYLCLIPIDLIGCTLGEQISGQYYSTVQGGNFLQIKFFC